MKRFDLFDFVAKGLSKPGVNLSAVARDTGLSRKTLQRVAKKDNDSRDSTLKKIAEALERLGV